MVQAGDHGGCDLSGHSGGGATRDQILKVKLTTCGLDVGGEEQIGIKDDARRFDPGMTKNHVPRDHLGTCRNAGAWAPLRST